jgi:hypothetical protein
MSEQAAMTAKAPRVKWGEIGRALAAPPFMFAAVFLLACAIGLGALVQGLRLHFKKLPVPLQGKSLKELPAKLGNWVQVNVDQPLNPDLQESLGTNEYVFRQYVNWKEIGSTPEATIQRFADLSVEDRKKEYDRIVQKQPTCLVYVAVTYYTGKVDTVPHIPERCYLADGYQKEIEKELVWGQGPTYKARLLKFAPEARADGRVESTRIHVGYFFQVNGQYTLNSLDVRSALQNLFVKYGYFAKVEVMSPAADTALAGSAMQDFLTAALPELEKILPNWENYKAR